jgi:hypothetical protein
MHHRTLVLCPVVLCIAFGCGAEAEGIITGAQEASPGSERSSEGDEELGTLSQELGGSRNEFLVREWRNWGGNDAHRDEDVVIGGPCSPGFVRSPPLVGQQNPSAVSSGNGYCSASWVSKNIRDCSVNVHLHTSPFLQRINCTARIFQEKRVGNDFDGDGRADAIFATTPSTAAPTRSRVAGSYRFDGRANGQLQAASFSRTDLTLSNGTEYTMGDFNCDGRTDTIITTQHGSFEYLGLATGGGFQADAWVRGDLSLGTVHFTPGDFNGDGCTDVVITTANGSFGYQGLSNGGFLPDVWIRTDLGSVAFAPSVSFASGDFDGNGASDLLISRPTPNGTRATTLVWGNRSGPVLSGAPVSLSTDTLGTHYLAGDFNGDGADDVLQIAEQGARVFLAGGGWFAAAPDFGRLPQQREGLTYMTGDFNGDGRTDLLINDPRLPYSDPPIVLQYLAAADGTFRSSGWSFFGAADYGAADFDGDGTTDVIVATPAGASLYLGTTNGGFTQGTWTQSDLAAPVRILSGSSL